MRVRLKQQRLLDLMAQSSLSQNHWAIKLGLSKGHWSAIVNGKHPFPSPRTRERMLETFGVAFDDLFEVEAGPAEGSDATFQSAIAEKYLIEREIGHGGMGTVYLTRDIKHGRQVAMKVISPEAVSGIGVQQFLKEIRLTARTQHHHILPLHDSGEAAGYPYYVTPYIEDGSLRDYLKHKKQLSVEETLQIARGIAAALQHSHEHSVLHCDIKPENILLSGTHAFVADFGISRAVHAEFFEWGRRSELDSSAGTPAYVSPEQASGERNLDQRSDVYSLACVVFEMLAGRPPFKGTTTMETVAQRFTAMPDLKTYAPHVPSGVVRAVALGMALKNEHRPATANELLDSIEDATKNTKPWVEAVGLFTSRVMTSVRRVVRPKTSARRQRFMDSVLQDLRYAIRSLLRQPMVTGVVGLTLALGIGLNTAIFSVLYGVLFQPLAYEEPDRLMYIGRTRPELPDVLLPISPTNFVDLVPQVTQFGAIEARTGTSFIMDDGDNAALVSGNQVTPGFLDLFGVPPQLGRTFIDEDGLVGEERVVVVSHGFWQNRLGGDPDVIGSTVRFTETPYTVVGVMPPGFRTSVSFFVPFQWDLGNLGNRRGNFINLYGRLAPGAPHEAASAELHSLWTALGAQQAEGQYDDSGMRAERLLEATVSRSRTPLFILAGAVGLVLIVACANVANLMLARSEARHREIALRAALGAGRRRLIRQFLTESLVLSVTGGLVGLVAAFAGMRVMLALSTNAIPRVNEVGMNGVVLTFALAVSVLTGIVVGLAPALQAKPNHAALKDGARGTSGRMTLLRQGLVVMEVALALMLVTGTGLLLKSFWNAQQAEMGFDTENLLIVNTWLPPSRYEDTAAQTTFFETLLPQLRALPQVRQAGMTNLVPVESFGNNFTTISPVGDDERQSHFVEARQVTETYFETMGIPLVRGRSFGPSDLADRGATVVVNEELVRQLFDGNPVGERIGGDLSPREIIGVVGDIRGYRPDEHPRPTIYFPTPVSSNLMVRTATDPQQVAGQIRQVVAGLDPAVRVYDVDVMSDIIEGSLVGRKFQLILLLVFAGVALTLGAVGIYGVMSYSVAQQTRELGVRMALGALPGDVLKLVVLRGGMLALIGVVIGGTGTFLLRKVLEGVLFDVSATDPLTYGSVALLLIGVAVVACFVPARRAAAVDPMEALRYE